MVPVSFIKYFSFKNAQSTNVNFLNKLDICSSVCEYVWESYKLNRHEHEVLQNGKDEWASVNNVDHKLSARAGTFLKPTHAKRTRQMLIEWK